MAALIIPCIGQPTDYDIFNHISSIQNRHSQYTIIPPTEPQNANGSADVHFLSRQPDTSLHCQATDGQCMALRRSLSRMDFGWSGWVNLSGTVAVTNRDGLGLQTIAHPKTNRAQRRLSSYAQRRHQRSQAATRL